MTWTKAAFTKEFREKGYESTHYTNQSTRQKSR
jgi:hypothetical protein